MRAIDFFNGGWAFANREVIPEDVIRRDPKFRYLSTITVLIFALEAIRRPRPKREATRAWPGFYS